MQAFILVTLATSTGLLAGATVTDHAYSQGQKTFSELALLSTLMSTIDEEWVGESETTDLVHGAAAGMVDALDRHSTFLNPEDYQKVREETDGMYFGIGIEIRLADEGARVTRVMPSSPAELADIRLQDIILSAEGQSLKGMPLNEITTLIRGSRGVPITLMLDRAGETLEKVVVRDRVLIPAVTASLFEPGLGYARIDEFQRRTGSDLKKAMVDMETQGQTALRGLVLDLRSNPGGLVDEAIAVADLFVSEGPILEVRGKDPNTAKRHLSTRSDDDRHMPLVILVDGSSASASEIVAGSLQALDRATLVGSTTYGKGSVQKLYELPDGSALKLTTARYYLPDGRAIEQDKGLEPDHIINTPSRLPPSWSQLRQQVESLDLDPATIDELKLGLDRVEDRQIKTYPIRIQAGGEMKERLVEDEQLRQALAIIRDAS
jgi:carboxyl-terminal processing protease